MSKFILIFILVLQFSLSAFSQVQVRGYYKSNGTYVQPHIRSSPNSFKSDNYGSARSAGSSYTGGYTNPNLRDSDHDGIANKYDSDDNNNGVHDDNE